MSGLNFLQDKLHVACLISEYPGFYRFTAARHAPDGMELDVVSVYDLCQAARNRRCTHGNAVNTLGGLFHDCGSLLYPKAMLFVYNSQGQVFIYYVFPNAGVRSDNDLSGSVCYFPQHSIPFSLFQGTVQKCRSDAV